MNNVINKSTLKIIYTGNSDKYSNIGMALA